MENFEYETEDFEFDPEFEAWDALEREGGAEAWESEAQRRARLALARAVRAGRRPARRPPPPRRPRPPTGRRPRGPRPPRRPRPPVPFPARRPVFVRGAVPPCVCPAHGTEFVRWVQSALNRLLGENLTVNGIMNAASRAALRRFQEQQGLPADGIAGPDTERALLEAQAGRAAGGAAAPAAVPSEPGESEFEDDFEWAGEWDGEREAEWQGEADRSSREYIRWVQASLNRILGTRLATDGINGPLTRSAVRSFQSRRGLAVDGVVGPVTEAALIAAGAGRPPGVGTAPVPRGGQAYPAVNVELPLAGRGFYSYDRTSAVNGQPHQFGRRETIDAIRAIGAAWARAHPNGPRIGVGHISLRGGGDTPSHAGHETGLEVDLRPVRGDGREAAVTIYDPSYSRALTQELVNAIRANGVLPVRRILFNDTAIPGVVEVPNHHHHLHVDFAEPPAGRGRYR